jgi:hypothetical protein
MKGAGAAHRNRYILATQATQPTLDWWKDSNMAATISAKCPHCGTRDIGFTFVSQLSLAPRRKKEWMVLFSCNRCQGGLVIEYVWKVDYGPKDPSQCNGDPSQLGYNVVTYYPNPTPTNLPSHVPDALGHYFTQASEAFHNRHYDASGAMSRKVVDVSTQKLLGEDAKKFGTINARINELASRGLLTVELKDWAHQIRLDGNEASHDEKPYTEDDAKELVGFAELYLTYVYSLPGRLKDKRERKSVAPPATV